LVEFSKLQLGTEDRSTFLILERELASSSAEQIALYATAKRVNS